MQGTYYSGPVSTVSGSIQLSSGLSSQLFSGPSVLLILQDQSGAATFGLPPYTLLQDMQVTLSGGGFSVGGVVAQVQFDPPDPPAPVFLGAGPGLISNDFASTADSSSGTPEPASFAMAAIGVALLAAFRRFRLAQPRP